jgi:hypothetical protein
VLQRRDGEPDAGQIRAVSRPPSQKGTSVLPVVQALKRNPNAWNFLPPSLWKYLDDPISVAEWYPERDYWILLEALVKTLDAAALGGDVFRYFARFSVQVDIGGRSLNDSGGARSPAKGLYSDFGNVTGPADLFRRAARLWTEYHDTGRMEVVAGVPDRNVVVVRLLDFVVPIEGFVRLQGYYLEEYARLVGLEVSATVIRSTARRDPHCEWEFALVRTPATEAYVASLPRR